MGYPCGYRQNLKRRGQSDPGPPLCQHWNGSVWPWTVSSNTICGKEKGPSRETAAQTQFNTETGLISKPERRAREKGRLSLGKFSPLTAENT